MLLSRLVAVELEIKKKEDLSLLTGCSFLQQRQNLILGDPRPGGFGQYPATKLKSIIGLEDLDDLVSNLIESGICGK